MTADAPLAAARVERVLPAMPRELYDAWLDESALADFICPAPGHAEVSIDPRVGGRLRFAMVFGPDQRIEVTGEYVVLEPHGDGETLMRITHELPPDEVDRHAEGWGSVADQLEARLRRVGSVEGAGLQSGSPHPRHLPTQRGSRGESRNPQYQ